MLGRFIKPASGFVTVKQADDIKKFFKTHSAHGANRSIAQVLEKIYSHAAWHKRDSKHIENWLNAI